MDQNLDSANNLATGHESRVAYIKISILTESNQLNNLTVLTPRLSWKNVFIEIDRDNNNPLVINYRLLLKSKTINVDRYLKYTKGENSVQHSSQTVTNKITYC